MKATNYLLEVSPAPVLSEARKRASINALRQRYAAHQQATGLTPNQELQQAQAGEGAK
ncbi:MAG: hypothetical protein ACRYFX_12650 [Janthinobacterium lividum]